MVQVEKKNVEPKNSEIQNKCDLIGIETPTRDVPSKFEKKKCYIPIIQLNLYTYVAEFQTVWEFWYVSHKGLEKGMMPLWKEYQNSRVAVKVLLFL